MATTCAKDNQALNYKDCERLVGKLAHFLRQRAITYGVRMTVDDAKSEISYVWVLCRDRFDPERGFKFSTYFTRAVQYNAHKIIRKFKAGSFSNEFSLTEISIDECDDDHARPEFQLVDEMATDPLQETIKREGLRIAEKLTPLAIKMTNLVQSAPEELVAELRAAQAQVEYARSLNLGDMNEPPNALTPTVLMSIFRLNWRKRAKIRNDIVEASSYV